MRRLIWTSAFLALVCVPGAFARQAPPASPRVIVMPFAVHADPGATAAASGAASYWLGEAATLVMSDELQALGVNAWSRAERVSAFERLHLPMAATLTRATMIRAGEVLGAAAIVVGDIEMGDRVRVHASVIRLDRGQQLAAITDEAAVPDLFALFERLARNAGGQIAGSPLAASREHVHPPLVAFEDYVKGLVAATPAAQEKFLIAAVKSAPAYDDARLALWSVQTAQGAYTKALATARAVTPASPRYRAARFSAALSLIDLNRYAEAKAALETLRREQPSAVLSNAIGVVQVRQGVAPAGPVASFTRAVTEDPENADGQFNLGYASALAADGPAALHWLREAVRRAPADGDAHLVLSAVLAASNQGVEGQREFDLATLLGAPHLQPTTAFGDHVPTGLERLRTDLDTPATSADATLASAGQRDQDAQAAFHLDHAKRLIAGGQDRDAADALRRAVFLSPYLDEPHLLLGAIDQRAGRSADAIDEFKLALWCRETAAAHLALAAALLDAGQRDGARVHAQRALVMEPDSTGAKALLTRIGGT